MLSIQKLEELLGSLPGDYPAPCIDKADFTDINYEDIEDYVLTWSKPGTLSIVQLSLSCKEEDLNKIVIKGVYSDSSHSTPTDYKSFLNQKLKELYETNHHS